MTDLTCAKCGKPIDVADTCYTPLDDPLTHYHCACWPHVADPPTYECLMNERNEARAKLRILRTSVENWAAGMELECVLRERWHDAETHCNCHDCTIYDAWKATALAKE